ncbi:MAG: hypothetical protein WC553_03740 [Patescibacteria group bacterium]|jgi:hypothetical protein
MELLLSKATFGILSSAFVLVGCVPYLNDIIKRRVNPHILSWIGWGFLTAIGAFAMMAEGSTWATALLWGNTGACVLIVLGSIITKTGVWSTGLQDYVFFGAGLLGIVLWQVLDMPILALIFAILADACFGIPTMIKTFKDPSTETPFVWGMSVVSEVFGLLALQNLSFHEMAYPVYLFIYDVTVLILILNIFKRKTIHISESEPNSPR